jgi:DNA polymerase-3 subunit gamma/tau
VFDFRRIMISDISKHLAGIAQKEGIEADPQALHVIAQKADGGLRDALSIFDQLVSFSGNRLTYQDVVKNLNVLDHEHYFRITDSIIRGDIPGAWWNTTPSCNKGSMGTCSWPAWGATSATCS